MSGQILNWQIQDYLNTFKTSGFRAIVHVSGDRDYCIAKAESLVAEANVQTTVWSGFDNTDCLQTHQKLKKLLGTEIDILVINAFEGFNPDILGIASGCIKAGGMFILLSPPGPDWISHADPDYHRMLSEKNSISQIKGRFIQHVMDCLSHLSSVWKIQQHSSSRKPRAQPHGDFVRNFSEQKKAITAIKRVATGHARRPLVLQADRGRGKTAALGFAAAELMQEKTINIIVTAPASEAVETLFFHAAQQLGICDYPVKTSLTYQDSCLQFVPVDQLIAGEYPANLVLIDEAAAIPSALLGALIDRYNRVVFSTTVQGYEGNGRGFAIRFRKTLDKKMPQWRFLELQMPVRWAPGDPLEKLCNDILLLKVEPAPVLEKYTPDFSFIDRDKLVHNKYRLQQIFGLLISAHYQTSPDDLRMLMDHPDVSIAIAEFKGEILGVALVMKEGGFSPEESDQIVACSRRVKGHLLPQALVVSGIENGLQSQYVRIVRIAVQPELQGQGIGRQLVQYIEKQGEADFLGTSFSAEPAVIDFWKKTGMQVVRLGIHKESSTGQYACFMLKGLTENSAQSCDMAVQRFVMNIPYQLLTVNHDITAATVISLLQGLPLALMDEDRFQCQAYLQGQRSFETVQANLHRFYMAHLCQHSMIINHGRNHLLMVEKLLLNSSWRVICHNYGLTGKKAVEKIFRKELALLLSE